VIKQKFSANQLKTALQQQTVCNQSINNFYSGLCNRIVNGGNGQWKRLLSRMGHALDDDDM